jgi:predicted PurR-regulated permease PerM
MSETSDGRLNGLVTATAGVVLALSLGAVLVLAKDVLVPLALATLLSFALSPVVRAAQNLGAPRAIGAVGALILFVGAIGLCVTFVSGQVSDMASQLPSYRHNIEQKVHGISQRFGGDKSSGVFSMIEDALKEAAPPEPGAPAPQKVVVVDNSPFSRISVIGSFASPVLSPLAELAIVLVFTAFLLAQQEDLRNRLIKLIGAKDIYRTTEAIDDAGRRVGRTLFAQVILNSVFGVVIAGGLFLIGLPNPALWGAIAAVARFVPYIGVLIGVVPPLFVAFGADPGWSMFFLTLALFVVAESIAGQVIEPLAFGHSSGLSPVAVVISASVWAFLWGPIGLVLATPLTTCLVVLGRHAPGLAFLETLLGDEPPLAAHETFYQRMLAGDPREAAAQARPFLKRGEIADYYDEVALEALRRAHVDVSRGDLDDVRLQAMTTSMAQLVARLDASKSGRNARWRRLLRPFARLRRGPSSAEARQDALLRSRRGAAVLHGEHPLDAIAAAMLVHALTRRGLPSKAVTIEEARTASTAERDAVALVCLCYIEPLTIAHLRGAVREARQRCPNAKVLVCLWRDPSGDSLKDLERRIRCDALATGVGTAGVAALALVGTPAEARERRRSSGFTSIRRGASLS